MPVSISYWRYLPTGNEARNIFRPLRADFRWRWKMDVVSIILALLAIGGTLGGTWLGSHLSKSNEEWQWRRQHCLDAYTEVLAACDTVALKAENIYFIELEGPDLIQQKTELDDN